MHSISISEQKIKYTENHTQCCSTHKHRCTRTTTEPSRAEQSKAKQHQQQNNNKNKKWNEIRINHHVKILTHITHICKAIVYKTNMRLYRKCIQPSDAVASGRARSRNSSFVSIYFSTGWTFWILALSFTSTSTNIAAAGAATSNDNNNEDDDDDIRNYVMCIGMYRIVYWMETQTNFHIWFTWNATTLYSIFR